MEVIGTTRNGDAGNSDTLMLFGGVACLILGAGLLLSSSNVRRYLGEVNAGDLLGAAVPDVERYLKLQAM